MSELRGGGSAERAAVSELPPADVPDTQYHMMGGDGMTLRERWRRLGEGAAMKRTGGCNCPEEAERELRIVEGDPEGRLRIPWAIMPFNEGDQVVPYFDFSYRKPKGANRGKTKKVYLRTVVFAYCPFCGRKYR
jgi:hypothetical protein